MPKLVVGLLLITILIVILMWAIPFIPKCELRPTGYSQMAWGSPYYWEMISDDGRIVTLGVVTERVAQRLVIKQDGMWKKCE